jgi:hypothetical protein
VDVKSWIVVLRFLHYVVWNLIAVAIVVIKLYFDNCVSLKTKLTEQEFRVIILVSCT